MQPLPHLGAVLGFRTHRAPGHRHRSRRRRRWTTTASATSCGWSTTRPSSTPSPVWSVPPPWWWPTDTIGSPPPRPTWPAGGPARREPTVCSHWWSSWPRTRCPWDPSTGCLSGLPDGLDLVDAFASWFDVSRAGDFTERTSPALGGSSALALVMSSGCWLLSPRRTGPPRRPVPTSYSSMVALVLAELPEHELTFANSWQDAVAAVAVRGRPRRPSCSPPWPGRPDRRLGPTPGGGCPRRAPSSTPSPVPVWSSGPSTRERLCTEGRAVRSRSGPVRPTPGRCEGTTSLSWRRLTTHSEELVTGRTTSGRRACPGGCGPVRRGLRDHPGGARRAPAASAVRRPATTTTAPRPPSPRPSRPPCPRRSSRPPAGPPGHRPPPAGGFTSVSCISDVFCLAAGGGSNEADAADSTGPGVVDVVGRRHLGHGGHLLPRLAGGPTPPP